MSSSSLDKIRQEVITCQRCPRLIPYIREVAIKKVRRYMDWDYWGKPVPGFGDPGAELLIIGLAPGAHGANRTGRMFTGDSSGDWLYRALYEAGFANQPNSTDINDGLQLINTYITAIGRCAPPQNKPTTQEIETCSSYLEEEIRLLKNVKVILCLGGLSFNRFRKLNNLKGIGFGHGAVYSLENGKTLVCSYHPSRQNTNTGKLLWNDWLKVFMDIRQRLSQ